MSYSTRIKILNADWTLEAAPVSGVLLYGGDGFQGDQPELDPVGDPLAPGYDCKSIVRWDVVPWQGVQDGFTAGVVAYHRAGIAWVDFSLNGGPWVRVTESSLNERTGEEEYFAQLVLDGDTNPELELRAIVVPICGIPRVLAGPLSIDSLKNGEHSLYLRNDEVLTPQEFFVSNQGSDSTGDGSRENPFETIGGAAFSGCAEGDPYADVGGMILTLLPGDYEYTDGGYPQNALEMQDGWLTIRSETSSPSSATRLTGWSSMNWEKMQLKGLQIVVPDQESGAGNYTGKSTACLWLDNCDVQGRLVQTYNFLGYGGGKWATDCNGTDVQAKPFGTVITRNCHLDGVIEDSFGFESLLLSSSVRRLSRNIVPDGVEKDYHNDVWQNFNSTGTVENLIVRGLTAVDRIQGQGVFMSNVDNAFIDMAFIDVNISNNDDTFAGNETTAYTCLGIFNPLKHVLFYDSSYLRGYINGPDPVYGTVGGQVLIDVVFKNNIVLDPVLYTNGDDYFVPWPDGPSSVGGGIYPGTLPWTSPDSNILYLE